MVGKNLGSLIKLSHDTKSHLHLSTKDMIIRDGKNGESLNKFKIKSISHVL